MRRLKQLLLVMPPQSGLLSGFSTGLISLVNYINICNPVDVEASILDLSTVSVDHLESKIAQKINYQRDLIVGITTTTASYQAALATARMFKKLRAQCTTIFGGHHASADAETVLRSHKGQIDYICIGEGEKFLLEFLNHYPYVHEVCGLAFLRNDDFIYNPPAPYLKQEELNQISTLVQNDGFHSAPGKFEHVSYVSARGCPLSCAFCSVSGEPIREKSIQNVVEDIGQLVDLGYTRIAIEDNFFAHSHARTKELCQALAKLRSSGVYFTWDCQTRVESLTPDNTIPLLESAGCEAVYIGVESLNADQLIYLSKTVDPGRYLDFLIRKVVPDLLKSKVNCFLNLQFGLPNETAAHDEETLDMLIKLGSDAVRQGKSVTIFPQLHVVYPGTRHFRLGVQARHYPTSIFETFTEWETRQAPVLHWLGEHFAHGTGGIPEGILNSSKLSEGHFEVNAVAVLRISNLLTTLARISGIKVFKYGTYLVPTDKTRVSNTSCSRAYERSTP